MRSVVYRRSGDPAEVLEVVETPEPGRPGASEVLVRVTMFPVHHGDLLGIEAPFPTGASGAIAVGIEATGVVEAVGAAVRVPGIEPGARVTFFPRPGAWSEKVLVDVAVVVPVPESVDNDVAAQMLLNPLTAIILRREMEKNFTVGYNGVVVQTAAGSSVGRLITCVSQFHQIPLINVVRSDDGAHKLAERFPEVPVVSTAAADWRQQVRDHAGGRPVHCALDPIGGELAGHLLDLLAPGGTLVTYGQMAPEAIPVPASKILATGLGIRGVTILRWGERTSPEQRASDLASARQMVAEFKDQFDVAGRYELTDLADAVRHIRRPGKVGSVLVTI
jgi:NADPH:quinone reductase-like Zn-dependent oxidoreductase